MGRDEGWGEVVYGFIVVRCLDAGMHACTATIF